MPPEPGSPDDWMRFARSDLELVRGPVRPGVLPETLCFHAQQAVEKALKAVALSLGIEFPYTHNLKALVGLLPPHISVPDAVRDATELTDYAVATRYPGEYEPVTDDDYREAVRVAEAVLLWAEQVVASGSAA